ncbi:MAG TPA: M28 family peptidase [Pyrinomonadaceae bacterium]|nr:M28 family peptidase [Pyrinomonadaceae bacterium]
MKSNPFSNPAWRKVSVLLLACALLASPALGQGSAAATATKPAATLSAAEREAAASVRVETIKEVVVALSDKGMEGRGTAQAGGDRAAKYIADRFSKLGLKPLGDAGSYLQAIKFNGSQPLSTSSFKAGDASLKFGSEFIPAPPFMSESAEAKGGLVFITYGVVSEELKRDDLAGLDVKGKIIVVLNGRPKNVDEAAWNKANDPRATIGGLIKKGAVAVVIANAGSKEQPFSLIGMYLSRRRVALGDAPTVPFAVPPIILAGDEGMEKLFAGTGLTYAQALSKAENGEAVSRDLNKQAEISIKAKKESVTGSNVVGYMEGSDPKLKDQAIIYTAHYDAYGIDTEGRIFPGAADNALGVGEILAIAEAFTKSPTKPRRSVIFLTVTGEEHGLLGAEYWVAHPTWPLEKLAADLNFDGIGTEVYAPVKSLVGFGAEHSDLGPVFDAVVVANGGQIVPDPFPEEKVFYRSDHYAFVKKGVPSLMPLGGPGGDITPWLARAKKWMETDYHQPGDIIRPDWNWDGARTVAVIGLVTGMRVANAEAMPMWLPSSPFNKPRIAPKAAPASAPGN